MTDGVTDDVELSANITVTIIDFMTESHLTNYRPLKTGHITRLSAEMEAAIETDITYIMMQTPATNFF